MPIGREIPGSTRERLSVPEYLWLLLEGTPSAFPSQSVEISIRRTAKFNVVLYDCSASTPYTCSDCFFNVFEKRVNVFFHNNNNGYFKCYFSREHIALSHKQLCVHRNRKNQQIKSTAHDGKSYLKKNKLCVNKP